MVFFCLQIQVFFPIIFTFFTKSSENFESPNIIYDDHDDDDDDDDPTRTKSIDYDN
jgi:hypothetical protein